MRKDPKHDQIISRLTHIDLEQALMRKEQEMTNEHLRKLNGTVADHEKRFMAEDERVSYNKGKTSTLKYIVTLVLAVAAIVVTYFANK